MINLSLVQISTFLTVVETRSFRHAAERLHISQPAVSARVSNLEAILGVRLLNRTTRSVTLTREGERLVAAASRTLAELHSLADQLREEAALQRGRVVLGALPSMAATLLPPALAAFRKRFPGVSVELYDSYVGRVLEYLTSGQVDLAVMSHVPPQRGLSFTPLFRDECLIVVPRGHPLSRRRAVTLAEVGAYPLILPARGTGFRETVEAAFVRADAPMRGVHEAFNLSTLLGLAEAGFGITFVPSIFAAKLDLSRCRTLHVKGPPMSRDIGIVVVRGRSLSPAAEALSDFLKENLAAAMANQRRGTDAPPRQPRGG